MSQRYADEFVVYKTECGLWQAKLTVLNSGDAYPEYRVTGLTRRAAVRNARRLRDKGNGIHAARAASREWLR